MDYRIVEMTFWPGGELEADEYDCHEFGTTYARTLEHLERELEYLEGSHVVFQLTGISQGDIRQDGRLYAHARANPPIVVTFNSKHGPLSYYCDHYADWKTNLRAITITLQNLRKIDEHGVNERGDQYQGYKRLPAAGETGNGRPRIESKEEAASFISEHLDHQVSLAQLLESAWLYEVAYKNAAKMLHPDNLETGNDDLFVDLQDAAALLRSHHGL